MYVFYYWTCRYTGFNYIIMCIISLAPPTLINHKICEVKYQFMHHLHMLKTCIFAAKICKILCASCIVLRIRQLNSKGGERSTSEIHTFDADACDLSVS